MLSVCRMRNETGRPTILAQFLGLYSWYGCCCFNLAFGKLPKTALVILPLITWYTLMFLRSGASDKYRDSVSWCRAKSTQITQFRGHCGYLNLVQFCVSFRALEINRRRFPPLQPGIRECGGVYPRVPSMKYVLFSR